jgi:ABC-type Fe3+-hydroxamate transport system substrate-binding protein
MAFMRLSPTPTMPPFVDGAGNDHAPAGATARIVSLVPSLTELLFALGLGVQVVGRTTYCVHPAEGVCRVPTVGGTKTIDLDKVSRLRPSHLLVNVDETPKAIADAVAQLGIDVVVTHPIHVDDNIDLYHLIGGLFGRPAAAAALSERYRAARATIDAAARRWPDRHVLYVIWKKPWMTVGPNTYIAHMLRLARMNATVTGGDEPVRYPTVDLDERLLDRLDLVLFATEPFPFRERHVAEFRQAFPGHEQKARLINGEMLSWYGSRAIDGLAYLADFTRRLAGTASTPMDERGASGS